MMSFGHFNDHDSPITSSAEPSSVSSPVIFKPPPLSYPNNHKQRSSLMNSISLNHSVVVLGGGHQNGGSGVVNCGTITPNAATPHLRSMSVVSLDSPRNSIALIEDTRMIRNNSTNSLVSLSNQSFTSCQNIVPISLKARENFMLEDDFRLDDTSKKVQRPTLKPRLRLRDSKLDNIKQDFKLNYDLNQSCKVLEVPSPLSLTMDKQPEFLVPSKLGDFKYERNHVHFDLLDHELQKPTERNISKVKDNIHINTNSTTNSELNTNEASPPTHNTLNPYPLVHGNSQNHPLAPIQGNSFSIDNANTSKVTNSSNNVNTVANPDVSKKKWKANSMQQSLILKKKMIYSKDLQLELNHSLSSSALADSKYITPTTLLENSKLNPSSNLNSNLNITKQPVFETLTQKNKLIRQLNQKWNKSSEKEMKFSAKHNIKPLVNFHVSKKRRFLSDDEFSDYDPGY